MREWFNAVVDFMIQMGIWFLIGFVVGGFVVGSIMLIRRDKEVHRIRGLVDDWQEGRRQATQGAVREARPAPRPVRDTQVLRRNLEDAETVVIEMNGDQHD